MSDDKPTDRERIDEARASPSVLNELVNRLCDIYGESSRSAITHAAADGLDIGRLEQRRDFASRGYLALTPGEVRGRIEKLEAETAEATAKLEAELAAARATIAAWQPVVREACAERDAELRSKVACVPISIRAAVAAIPVEQRPK